MGEILSSECLVMHEEKIDIIDVMNEESLVARGHKVPGLPVCSITNLWFHC
jgi:hypothetical protein